MYEGPVNEQLGVLMDRGRKGGKRTFWRTVLISKFQVTKGVEETKE